MTVKFPLKLGRAKQIIAVQKRPIFVVSPLRETYNDYGVVLVKMNKEIACYVAVIAHTVQFFTPRTLEMIVKRGSLISITEAKAHFPKIEEYVEKHKLVYSQGVI
jgi:hypothetical protein